MGRLILRRSERSDIVGNLELSREFGRRPSSNVEEPYGVTIAATLIALCNIRWNGDGRTADLIAEGTPT